LQPLLNPERDSEYYRLLGVDRKASGQAIKRAYHNLARSQHPDKRAQRGEMISESDVAEFQRIKEAYECLSDGKRRRVYDTVGELGLQLTENPASVSPESVIRKVSKVGNRCRCLVLFFIFCCVGFFTLYTPILVSLNVDGATNISWGAVFLPIWIIDVLVLINAVAWVYEGFSSTNTASSDGAEDIDVENERQHQGSGAPPNADRPAYEEDDEPYQTDEEDMAIIDDTPKLVRIIGLIRTLLILCFQILLVIHLDTEKIALIYIFIPLFAREALALIELIPGAFCIVIEISETLDDDALSATTPDSRPSGAPPAEHDDGEDTPLDPALERELKQIQQVQELELRDARRRSCRHLLLRISFELLLLLKLNGPARTCSWWLIFFPVWIEAAFYLQRFLSLGRVANEIENSLANSTFSPMLADQDDTNGNNHDKEKNEQLKQQAVATAQANALSSLCSCICLILIAIIIVLRCIRLRNPIVPAAVIFSPLFLIVFCCYCTIAAFIWRFRSLDDLTFAQDTEDEENHIAQSAEEVEDIQSTNPEFSNSTTIPSFPSSARHTSGDSTMPQETENTEDMTTSNQDDDNNTPPILNNSALFPENTLSSLTEDVTPPPPPTANDLELVSTPLHDLD